MVLVLAWAPAPSLAQPRESSVAETKIAGTVEQFHAWREALLRGDAPPPAWMSRFFDAIGSAAKAPDPGFAGEVAIRIAREQFAQQALMHLPDLGAAFPPYRDLEQTQLQPFWQSIDAEMQAVFRQNAAWLKQRFEARGAWWKISEVGERTASDLWLQAQHADHDPELQGRVLKAMEMLLGAGEVSPAHYAYLWDRVAKNAGRPQRYGTQIIGCQEGRAVVHPIEDLGGLEARRLEHGLEPHADYLAGNCLNFAAAE